MVHATMDMKIDEGRYHGARYYTVEPQISWEPTNELSSIIGWMDLEKWCIMTFGPAGLVWEVNESGAQRWYINGAKFWFREKKDLEWFVLKWS